MSNWTHVAGIVRVDSIRGFEDPLDFTEIFGKECLWASPSEVWDEAEDHPDRFLPMGSEGSLQISIWDNPNKNCMAAYTVSIFGDLRNHDNPQSIVDWFSERMEECNKNNIMIRQAVITVENEWNGTVTWEYKRKD